MIDWQVTATTIHCDAIDDDVTIVVHKDWTTVCTGYGKYVENLNTQTAGIVRKKEKISGKPLRCEGPMDYRVMNYRNKLASEENKAV